MKKLILICIVGLATTISYAQTKAFPSAEGYGKYATGGRGNGTNGRVAIVTNLEDDVNNPPEGSFRWALKQGVEYVINPVIGEIRVERPLTIVFQVGGTINLKGDIRVNRSNLTIAGQTAPGDGICFRGYTLNFGGSKNLIVRYIRSRPGDESGEETSAFRIENGGNFIIDHCSFSWAIEETTHFSSNNSTTVQWCIVSESLYNSIHKKGARGYATQWGGEYSSYHHNLLAHHNSRMPRIDGSSKTDIECLVDYRNNVNYNWGSKGAFYGGEWEGTNGKGFSHVNVVNNYFIPGPATPSNPVFARPSLNRGDVTLDGYAKWYIDGNIMEGTTSFTDNNWAGIDGSGVGGINNIKYDNVHYKTIDITEDVGSLENYNNYTETALQAKTSVLENVGATLPKRDAIDQRVINEINGGAIVRYSFTTEDGQTTPNKGLTSGLIDTQWNLVDKTANSEATPWDIYQTTSSSTAPLDSDKDGIPDEWEIANGLNPNDAADAVQIPNSQYSNLELYLFSLTGEEVSSSFKNISNNQIHIYPIPIEDKLHFSSTTFLTNVEIYTLSGNLIKSKAVFGNNDFIDFSDIQKGVYLMKSQAEDGSIITKQIIKK